jgi:hypothetical protein
LTLLGVTGFDLDKPGNGSMPRTHGWPRQKSVQKSNANNEAAVNARLMAQANMVVNPIMSMPMVAR